MSNSEIHKITHDVNKLRKLIDEHTISIDDNYKNNFDNIYLDDTDKTSDMIIDEILSSENRNEEITADMIIDSAINSIDDKTETNTYETEQTDTYETEQTNTFGTEETVTKNSYSVSTVNIPQNESHFLNTETENYTMTPTTNNSINCNKQISNKRYFLKK
jgi:hypothetical protein